jgi:hypothetical protein
VQQARPKLFSEPCPALKTQFRLLLIDFGMHATIARVVGSLAQAATAES